MALDCAMAFLAVCPTEFAEIIDIAVWG